MPPVHPEANDFPFLTREMLSFSGSATFGLRIRSISTATGQVTIRGATRDGVFTFRHTPNVDSTWATELLSIPDLPIWISVVDEDESFSRGNLYVIVDATINGDAVHSLLAGYTYKGFSLTWPQTELLPPESTPANLTSVVSSNPAAGAELSLTVPSDQMWRVKGARFTLVAAAAAANRRVHFQITDDDDNVIYDCASNTDQIISETKTYACFPNNAGGAATDGDVIYIPIPSEILMRSQWKIKTLTTALDSGDNFGIMRVFIERFFARD